MLFLLYQTKRKKNNSRLLTCGSQISVQLTFFLQQDRFQPTQPASYVLSELELISKKLICFQFISIYFSGVRGMDCWGDGVVFYLGLGTDSFISQSNLAVCVQEGGQGGSGGTWYQTGMLHWSKCVYVCV